MLKPGRRCHLFEDKKQSSTPITLKNLSETPNGQIFYNTYRGSLMQDAPQISFKPTELQEFKLINLQKEELENVTSKGT